MDAEVKRLLIETVNQFDLNRRVLYAGTDQVEVCTDLLPYGDHDKRRIDVFEPIYKDYYKLLDAGLFETVINDNLFEYDLVNYFHLLIINNTMPNGIDFIEWFTNNFDHYDNIIIVSDQMSRDYWIKNEFNVKEINKTIIAFKKC